ncbi:MAG: hypothetical protein HY833_02455 [Candidatus Aenigmarchaeota archaeon]|nr:hypothetical protein [Candidatus Aenigmarchaeota archaeon]
MQAQRYLPRKVSEVSKSDSRISILGTVSSVKEGAFEIKDESGSVEISSDSSVKEGDIVRAFCNVIDGRLKSEAVQSLNGLDLNLYQKAQELSRKIGI